MKNITECAPEAAMLTYCPVSLAKLRDPGSLCLKGFAWMGMTIKREMMLLSVRGDIAER